ncbi:MAG: hypothetical protein ACTHJ3_12125 [Pararhizobium sp.]
MKLVLTAAALAAGFSLVHAPSPEKASVDPVMTASIAGMPSAGPSGYLISNPGSAASCTMVKAGGSGETVALAPNSACEKVWPGLGSVVALSRTGRGTHALETAAGKAVLTLAAGDGVAYEAIAPRDALVTVSEIR